MRKDSFMNITSISPALSSYKNTLDNKTNINNKHFIQPKYKNTLAQDTVSFTARPMQISDFFAQNISDNMGRFGRLATTYLDILESVALRLGDDGVSFDRAYCELHPVKSPESYTSKVLRSGSFKVSDAIRATLYVKNPYDLSLLNDKILPEMQKRGYVLAHTDIPHEELIKRGYLTPPGGNLQTAKVYRLPDLDIRLENARENIYQLSPHLRYSISKPQVSGYEDIQMRFIREFDKKKNPVQHELIILFGPNYAHAKQLEYDRVYKFLREFHELRMKFSDETLGSHSQKASRYISLIQQMFRGKVSEKLFLNAKNKDLYDLSDEVPINFSETDIKMFESYFSGLKDRLASCYKEEKKHAEVSESALKQLNSDLRHDRTLLKKVQDNLRETIEYFNHQSGLKETKD